MECKMIWLQPCQYLEFIATLSLWSSSEAKFGKEASKGQRKPQAPKKAVKEDLQPGRWKW